MAKTAESQTEPIGPDYPLGGFDWIDGDTRLRRWFAAWLCGSRITGKWYNIYWDALNKPTDTTVVWRDAYPKMKKAVARIARRLPGLSSHEQLALVNAEARKLGLSTTRERVEDLLRLFLESEGNRPENAAALKASPWCNCFAVEKHVVAETPEHLGYKFYPVTRFSANELKGGITPEMATKNRSEHRVALETVRVHLYPHEPHRINRMMDSGVFPKPTRVDRTIAYAVRWALTLDDGPKRLAHFLSTLLNDNWPRIRAGQPFDLAQHFDSRKHKLVAPHLDGTSGRARAKLSKALLRILWAVGTRPVLREALLTLAVADDHRPGRKRLETALTKVFEHGRRKLKDQKRVNSAWLWNYPELRGQKQTSVVSRLNKELTFYPETGEAAFSEMPDGQTKVDVMNRRARTWLKKNCGLD